MLGNERYCGNVLTWKTFTADLYEHKHKKNRQGRDAHPAVQGVVYCDKLFEIERYCKEHDYSYEQRYEYRLKKAPPILSALLRCLLLYVASIFICK
jgi:hypothetical protein